jgi:hypothetical protein
LIASKPRGLKAIGFLGLVVHHELEQRYVQIEQVVSAKTVNLQNKNASTDFLVRAFKILVE